MFEHWADPVVYILLLESSMPKSITFSRLSAKFLPLPLLWFIQSEKEAFVRKDFEAARIAQFFTERFVTR